MSSPHRGSDKTPAVGFSTVQTGQGPLCVMDCFITHRGPALMKRIRLAEGNIMDLWALRSEGPRPPGPEKIEGTFQHAPTTDRAGTGPGWDGLGLGRSRPSVQHCSNVITDFSSFNDLHCISFTPYFLEESD
ncbi:unnamed protein product [Lota lota]